MAAADRLADRWLQALPVYRGDLHRCTPSDALSTTPQPHVWRMVLFETDLFSGTMLLAGPETAAPDLTYPLGATGWHAVSFGIYADTPGEIRQVAVKLSGDDTFTYVTVRPDEAVFQSELLTERFWRIVDLTGHDLQFGQVSTRVGSGDEPGSFVCQSAYLAYIKLVPLTDAEIAEVQTDRVHTETRRIFVHNDAHGYIWHQGAHTEEQIRRELEPFRDTDVARVYWEAGQGDLTYYHSQIGRLPTVDSVTDFTRVGDRVHAETWRQLHDSGVDPLLVVAQYARKIGVELHAGYRVAGFHYPPPVYDSWNVGSFAADHPELRGMDRAGNSTPRISYAYPETRTFVVSLLSEMAAYPIDGIALLYNRRPPLLEYEPPLTDSFKDEFGQDPREMDPCEPRWLIHRATALTQFMRELRAALDEAGQARGAERPVQVSAVVMGSLAENMLNGMDLRAWVGEGLVDTLIPYTSAPSLDSQADAWLDVGAINDFVELVRDTPCLLAPNLMPRLVPPETLRRRAAGLYGAGAHHFFAWDCDAFGGRPRFDNYWDVLRRLGHRDEVETWTDAGELALPTTTMRLRVLGDWDLTYATPG